MADLYGLSVSLGSLVALVGQESADLVAE